MLHRLYKPETLPDLTGNVYIVTGGNAGIGLETVYLLAAKGAKVYIASRSEDRANAAIDAINNKISGASVEFLKLDLQDLQSVVDATEEFRRKETKLHGLINNAGVMAIDYMITKDGYEGHIQTNYISHWLLTYHLLPVLIHTSSSESTVGCARVINLSSAAHMVYQIKKGVDLEDINLEKAGTYKMTRYSVSKLCNILHTKELERRYGTGSRTDKDTAGVGEVWTAALHPGLVKTGLTTGAYSQVSAFSSAMWRFMIAAGMDTAPEKSAYGTVYAACSPKLASGSYMVPVAKVGKSSGKSNNADLAKKLWEWTEAEMKKKGFI